MANLEKRLSLSERLQSVPRCLLQRNKSIKVEEFSLTDWEITGVQRCLADDFTHICMEMHWRRLLFFVLATYAAASFVFACILHLTDGIEGLGGDLPPSMSPFELCWWFAVVNVVTAGFGSMTPVSTKAYVVSTAAHFVGLFLNALLLGIVVAKASLPSAKMIFSNVICVRTRNGIQQLMVRVGNARGNILFSPDIRFVYVRATTTAEGETFFSDTFLNVRVPAALKPAFTITHPVTQDSPINGKSEQDITKERGFFLLIVSATDVETGQSIYARRLYFMKDFRFNHMFEDVISERALTGKTAAPEAFDAVEGAIRRTRVIDFLKFHDTRPLDVECWKEGERVCEPSRRFGILAPPPGVIEEVEEHRRSALPAPVTQPERPSPSMEATPPVASSQPVLPHPVALPPVLPAPEPPRSKPIGQYPNGLGKGSPFVSLDALTSVAENEWETPIPTTVERSYSADELGEFRDQLANVFPSARLRRRQKQSMEWIKEPSFDCWASSLSR